MHTPDTHIPSSLTDAVRRFVGEDVHDAVILGSGLGGFAERLDCGRSISTADLPGYPHSTVPGHAGRLHLCHHGDRRLLLFQGRVHGYEGYAPGEVVLPVRIAAAMGARRLLVTNAAGGLHPTFQAGDLMLITDVLSLPVARMLDMERLFGAMPEHGAQRPLLTPALADAARRAAADCGVSLREGVYCYCSGPSYETPTEIGFFRGAGVDAVGMSTVPEILAARHAGMETLGISCITNKAATVRQRVTHDEVTRVAARVADSFSSLVLNILTRW